jgi:ribosomal protein S18 acetylase RimI-like enzyme
MVAEEVRRRGIGHNLMVAAENWSASKGAAYVALATRRASDFYLALGYTESAAYFRKLVRAREQTSPGASTNRPPGPFEVDARGSARALNWGADSGDQWHRPLTLRYHRRDIGISR